MVDPRFSWGLTRVTPRLFEKHIRLLLRHKFVIQTITDYLKPSQQNTHRAAITFDDGYESVYQYAFPVLKKFKVPASVFINPAYMGQYNTWDVNIGGRRFRHMDWRQVSELSQHGWEIGSHGMRHRDLSRLSAESVVWELALSSNLIERKIGHCSSVLSYPFGRVRDLVVSQASQLNFKYGLAMGMPNKDLPLQYSVVRTGIYLFDLSPVFRLKAYVKYNSFFNFMQIVMDKCSDVTVACKLKSWTLN